MELKNLLINRFNKNMQRHKNTTWDMVESYLNENNLKILSEMEETGGEPDCVEYNGRLLYVDMVPESPVKRRSLCYDKESRIARKKFPPVSSVIEEVTSMNVNLVDEEMYLFLQTIEPLDQKTSSWLKTPREVRDLKGAIFGDHRFGRTFVFHNSADSYYKDRGFRSFIELK